MKLLKTFFRTIYPRLSKHLYHDCMVKKIGLENQLDKIKLLALGSSHCKHAFSANLIPDTFNLGTDNQDLYTSSYLFSKYLPKMKNLKTVVLFYSVFSPGLELAKTKSYRDIALHHFVFNVPYSVSYLWRWKLAVYCRKKKFRQANSDFCGGVHPLAWRQF